MAQAIRPNIALIVDDDENQRGLIGVLLEETGFDVVEVDSSAEAVNILRNSAHKVILIVAAMQLLRFADGAHLAAYAQQWPWIRILITSDERQCPDQFSYATAFMSKPWQPLDMLIQAEKVVVSARRQ
jgi:CheY-like chemotaxis protein